MRPNTTLLALLALAGCAPPWGVFEIQQGFTVSEQAERCETMDERVARDGIWRPEFVIIGFDRRYVMPYATDERWVLDLRGYDKREVTEIREIRLRCGEEERELRVLRCGARAYVDPRQIADWYGRGDPETPCWLNIVADDVRGELHGIEMVMLRPSLRPALAPLTASDQPSHGDPPAPETTEPPTANESATAGNDPTADE
ncbi:MAG: hypothetical protein H6711_06280 [Myxococcales bacterium]|nr:hypothetical protein [Myxococcales bacterium]